MPLSPFDQEFRDSALPEIYAAFGEVMSYTPPGGSLVEGVLVIPDERHAENDAGDSFGRIRSEERIWWVQKADAKLVAAGVTPANGGKFTRSDGEVLRVDGEPLQKDGEWKLDLVEAY